MASGLGNDITVRQITVRQMDFGFPERLDPLIVPGKPEVSYRLLALSLLLPYLEPYLMRTMKEARKQIEDPELRDALERFSAQEGQHYQQHIRFNDAVRSFGFPELESFEAGLDADYRRFSNEKPLRWNLAYAEGFEALTTANALFAVRTDLPSMLSPEAGELWTWHLIEELEHRTVAFDVFEHVCGRYLYRLRVGTYAQWHMARWIAKVAAYLWRTDPRVESEFGGKAGRRARARRDRKLTKGSLGLKLRTYLPSYTPHSIEFTSEMQALSDHYTARAVRSF